MSNKKKNQHFVPKFYFKNFSNENNFISIINNSDLTIIENTPYSTHCRVKYMYGSDGVWEDKLNFLESEWALIISEIVKGKTELSTDEIVSLKKFNIYQRMRTQSSVDCIYQMKHKAYSQIVPIIAQSEGLAIKSEHMEGYIDNLI